MTVANAVSSVTNTPEAVNAPNDESIALQDSAWFAAVVAMRDRLRFLQQRATQQATLQHETSEMTGD